MEKTLNSLRMCLMELDADEYINYMTNELSKRNLDTGDFYSEEYCNFILHLAKKYGLYDEVKEGLKSLGFKNKEIDNVLLSINIPNADNETIMVEALKRLGKK